MTKRELIVGEAVQLNPETVKNKAFGGCFLVVTEPKEFGCQGYVQAPGETREAGGAQVYYRPTWEEMEELVTGLSADKSRVVVAAPWVVD